MLRVPVTGGTLCLDALTPAMVRVRRYAGAQPPPEPPLTRYGFLRRDWPPAPHTVEETADGAVLRTDQLTVTIADGRLSLADAAGATLLSQSEPASGGEGRGFRLRFDLSADERLFGLGDQTRERLEHRGTKGQLWVRNVASYIPVPLLLSSAGWGLLFNTTWRLAYDLGADDPSSFSFEAAGGPLDCYLFVGPSLKQLLARYTELAGRPALPPRWGLGLFFICRTQADCREMLDDARTFRREGIPCDAIGLEPGWMSRNYDFSTEKQWHPERFPIPPYAPLGPHNFLNALGRMGYKPGLWLCNDYDLSFEEERAVAAAHPEDACDEGAGFEQDEHGHWPIYADKLTKRDEPWFEHLKKFVDQGVCWFKQDGASQVNRHPDRLWGNGMGDDEMHNLYPLLYSRQMHQGFARHTGRRPFGFTVAGWAGFQAWTNTWTGDTGGGSAPLAACLNLSLSGHGMSTPDLEVTSAAGIHFGFLLPWTQLNSWNYFRHPWYQGDELRRCFRDYARLRYRLLPYLYSCCWQAHVSGEPVLRALPLEFPDDRACDNLLTQYLLGPSLLVGAYTDRIYLPAGEWHDVWTGQRHVGGDWLEPRLPAGRGGPLLARAGAIIPLGRAMDYVGHNPDDRLNVHCVLGPAGSFTLYEDDGATFAYEQGEYRVTPLRCEPRDGGWGLTVGPASGEFEGAPGRRRLRLRLHGLAEGPTAVEVDGQPAKGWQWDATRATLRVDAGWRGMERVEVVLR